MKRDSRNPRFESAPLIAARVVLVMLVFAAIANAQIDITSSRLTMYFPFDSEDFIGPYSGTCPLSPDLPPLVDASSIPFYSTGPGVVGGGLSFSSDSSSKLLVPFGSTAKLQSVLFPRQFTNQLTMMLWAKIDGYRLQPDGSCGDIRLFGDTLGNNAGFGITMQLLEQDDDVCEYRANAYVQVADRLVYWRPGEFLNGDGEFEFNVWNHWTLVWDGTGVRLFINGTEQLPSGGPEAPPYTLTLGVPTTYDTSIGGTLDDLRIYDVAFGENEISEVMKIPRSLGLPNINIETPEHFTLESSPQEEFLLASGVDPNEVPLAYIWELDPEECQVFSFPNGPTGAKSEISIFSTGVITLTGSATNGELCVTEEFTVKINASAVGIIENPQDQSVYKNESSTISVVVSGFPVPFISWQENVTEEFIVPGGSEIRTYWKPIPGQNSATLSLYNSGGTFGSSDNATRRREPGESRMIRAIVRDRLSGAVFESDPAVVTADTELRPDDGDGGDGAGDGDGGDGDDTPLAAIIVPVVVGSLLCCCCLLILLLLILLIAARSRNSGDSLYRIKLEEPDYTELAYGRMLEPHHAATKKQLPALQRLEMLMINSEYVFARSLCENAKATEADGLAKIVTYIYAGHNQAVGLVQHFTTREVEVSNKEGTLFRANSMASKMFTTYARIVASAYVWYIFARAVAELDAMAQQSERDEEEGMMGQSLQSSSLLGPVVMEVDPSKMEEAADDKVNTLQLWLVAQKLYAALENSSNHVPTEVRQILSHVHNEVASKFTEQAAHKAMGGFLFLRLLCPSLMAPQVYGLLAAPPHATSQRQLILLAKVMQNLANDTLPGKKEHYMERLNEFITSNQDSLRHFYTGLIRNAEDGPRHSEPVPQEVRTNAVVQLHKYITENQERTLALLGQEDEQLAEELRDILAAIGDVEIDDM